MILIVAKTGMNHLIVNRIAIASRVREQHPLRYLKPSSRCAFSKNEKSVT